MLSREIKTTEVGPMHRGATKGSHRRGAVSGYRRVPLLAVVAVLASGVAAPEPASAGPFVPDTFAAAGLGSHWKPVTPHGSGDVRVTGAGAGESLLALSVPAGVNHHPWTVNDSVRAVQPVWNGDLHVEAGFASMPYARYQLQGLTVAASETTFLRYEVHHDGAGLRLFAGLTVEGVPRVLLDTELPELAQVHLRVAREGGRWRLSWSPDGAAWSRAAAFSRRMAVSEVGPFAGNYDAAGNAPAFTALVDYVTDAAGPPPAGEVTPAGAPDRAGPSVAAAGADTRVRSALVSWTTDEVSTGRVEYGPTDRYGQESRRSARGLGHALVLPDLEPGTFYHYRIVATDLAGNATTTEDAVLTTAGAGEGGRFVSDDFDAAELAPHWRPVTPLGVGEVRRSGGGLALAVPAGHNHNPWTVNDAIRAVQAVADEDLSVEARFTSMPERRNQMQGLTVGESRITFLRYGVHSDGAGLRLFASVTRDGDPTVVATTALPGLEAVSLRVERTGDDWQLSWSGDGTDWTTTAVFTQRLVVTEVGPFAGSFDEGGESPAFTAVVDHVRAAEPAGGGDAPRELRIADVSVDASTGTVLVRSTTTRTATVQVEYGTGGSYGSTSEPTTAATLHRLRLPELARDTTYHYRLVATGVDGEVVRTGDRTFTTPAGNTGPTIDLWYGRKQRTGPVAPSQEWVNVLGNVSDPDGVASLTYSVNGGAQRPLATGPDDRRLQWPGDFNADIPAGELAPGDNLVEITATDGQGLVTTRTVTVRRGADGTTLPYQLVWSGATSPAAQAQVVDGSWTVSEDGLRTDVTGYDRVVALGDLDWSDYQLTVPVTVHELGPEAYSYLSGGPMIGVGLRWRGHSQVDGRQPAWGFYPTGAFAWYRFHEGRPRFELSGNDGSPAVHASPAFEIGTTYLLKVRVETIGEVTRYQAKLWSAADPEPGFWQLDIEDADGPASGAVALVAHQLDGTFGDVTVEPL